MKQMKRLRYILVSAAPPPDPFYDWLTAPSVFESSHRARWYQEEAHQRILESLQDNRSTLCVMATGLGKTQVFCALARDWPGPVCVLAHRDELVQQAKERLELITGEDVEIEQGEWRSGTARLVVASVQTLQRKSRLERLGADRFSLIISDEAHHYTARTYRRPLDFFKDAKVVGVTATPDRGDAMALGKIFDDVAYVYDIADGIADGWLVRIEGRRIETQEIDLSRVTASKGDLALNELDEAMVKAVEPICIETLKLCPDRQGIGFFPGVRSAELAMHKMNALKPDCAAFVSGETETFERRRIMDDYKRGRYQFLMNCQIATEGFDAPNTSVIIIGRPTKSRSLYAQMVGRGTRCVSGLVDAFPGRDDVQLRRQAILASSKPDCLVLDFVGNSGRHTLITPTDILGGNYSEAEVAKAKKLAEQNGGGDIGKQLEQARAELKRLATEYKAKVRSTVQPFDPFGFLKLDPDDYKYASFGAEPISEAQYRMLKGQGLTDDQLQPMSKRQASRVIAEIKKRTSKGLAELWQVRLLQRAGLDPKGVTEKNARAALNYLNATERRGFDPKVFNDIAFGKRSAGSDG